MAAKPAEIREARPGDLPALARLGARLSRWHHRMDPDRFFTVPGLEEGYAWWLSKELRNRRAVVLAAVAGKRVVGYAYGRIAPRDWNTLRERCGVGVDLIVLPGWRRKGLGRRLVLALVERLVARGAPRVVIEVAAKNPDAQAAFARMGFRHTMAEMAIEAPQPRSGSRSGGAEGTGGRGPPASKTSGRSTAPAPSTRRSSSSRPAAPSSSRRRG